MRYPFSVAGLLLSSSIARASAVVGGTRLMFDGAKNNAVITVENKGQSSNIVQSWLSVVDAVSPAKDALIITPPLFRLKVGEKGLVRVVRSGKKPSDDRESISWLNVREAPAMEYVPSKNVVQFATNSKIKLICRSAVLKGNTPRSYAGKLQWGKERTSVTVENSLLLCVNFPQVNPSGRNISGAWFVVSSSTSKVPVQSASSVAGEKGITWSVVNDYGMSGRKYTAIIQ